MKVRMLVGMLVAIALAGMSIAAEPNEVTVSGEMMCAKCTLKAEGVTKCQDVVVAKGEDGSEAHYYVVKNDVAGEAGHTCTARRPVTVTGTVAEKDGKSWITPSSIEFGD